MRYIATISWFLLMSSCVSSIPSAATPTPKPRHVSTFAPQAPECLAPANPGGGWDFTCRSITKIINETGLVRVPFHVTNMPGGGGGVAFSYVVSERNGDANLIVAASPATTLRIAQAQYGSHTENDVRWIGEVAADFAVLAVTTDSPYQTFEDLLHDLITDPESVTFGGGSAIGGQDHMKVLILAISAGLEPLSLNYTAFDGGGEALSALLDGFIDVFPGEASEVKKEVEAGKVRVLTTLTPARLPPPFDTTPTATELGYPAEWITFRGFFGPNTISSEAYNYWIDTLTAFSESSEWRTVREEAGLGEFFLAGDEFEAYVKEQVQNFRQLSRDLGLID